MLDILACPVDKKYPLELLEIVSDGQEVQDGALYCPPCGRFYPIIDGIPMLFPDHLRDRTKDLDFLAQRRGKLPDKIIKQGSPWHL